MEGVIAMPLPALQNWELTRSSLHRAARLLNAARVRYSQPMPNHLHHSLNITPNGLTTGVFAKGEDMPTAEVILDFATATVNNTPLNGYSLQTLSIEVLTRAELDVPMTNLNDETPFEVNPTLSADYAQALYSVFTAAARFKARLAGGMSPIVLWPHHFDLSFLWFATAAHDESAPHMNFGFSPGDEGIPRPYLYAYAYPAPENQTQIVLPSPAHWHTEGWTGVRVDYDDLYHEAYPESLIESIFMRVFETLSPLLAP
jgi:hypothetical protein